jgi:hypothetical protein
MVVKRNILIGRIRERLRLYSKRTPDYFTKNDLLKIDAYIRESQEQLKNRSIDEQHIGSQKSNRI